MDHPRRIRWLSIDSAYFQTILMSKVMTGLIEVIFFWRYSLIFPALLILKHVVGISASSRHSSPSAKLDSVAWWMGRWSLFDCIVSFGALYCLSIFDKNHHLHKIVYIGTRYSTYASQASAILVKTLDLAFNQSWISFFGFAMKLK